MNIKDAERDKEADRDIQEFINNKVRDKEWTNKLNSIAVGVMEKVENLPYYKQPY